MLEGGLGSIGGDHVTSLNLGNGGPLVQKQAGEDRAQGELMIRDLTEAHSKVLQLLALDLFVGSVISIFEGEQDWESCLRRGYSPSHLRNCAKKGHGGPFRSPEEGHLKDWGATSMDQHKKFSFRASQG